MMWTMIGMWAVDAVAASCMVPGVGHLLPTEEGAVVPVDFVPTVLTSGGCRDADGGRLDVQLVDADSDALAAEASLTTVPALRTIALPMPATLLAGRDYRIEATGGSGETWERTFTVGEAPADEHGVPEVVAASAWVYRIDSGFEHIGELEITPGEAPDGLGYVEVATADDPELVLEVAPVEEGTLYLSPIETRGRRVDRLCWVVTQVDGAGRRGEAVDVCTDDIQRDGGLGCSSLGGAALVGWLVWVPLLALRRR